jgi:hypothetical protein
MATRTGNLFSVFSSVRCPQWLQKYLGVFHPKGEKIKLEERKSRGREGEVFFEFLASKFLPSRVLLLEERV